MKKITRKMEKTCTWGNLIKEYNLSLKRLNFHYNKGNFINKNGDVSFNDYYMIHFEVWQNSKIISNINQYVQKDWFEEHNINSDNYFEEIDLIINVESAYSISQKIFLTYLNEEERKLFGKKSGSPILYIEKKVLYNMENVLYEEELADYEAYEFTEGLN